MMKAINLFANTACARATTKALAGIDRGGDCSLIAPASVNSVSKSRLWDAELNSPLGKALRFAVVGHDSIVSPVSALLRRCGPAAIGWFIIATLIWEPIYTGAFRSFAHVGKEVLERISPSLTHDYPGTAIAWIILVGFCMASLFDTDPNGVFAWVIAAYLFLFSCIGATMASAALRGVTAGQRIPTDLLGYTAGASAKPSAMADVMDDGPFSVDSAGVVLSTRRQGDNVSGSHDLALCKKG